MYTVTIFLISYFGLKLCIIIVLLTAVFFKFECSRVSYSLFLNAACVLSCLVSTLIAMPLFLSLNFIAVAISKVPHQIFDVGRISTVSDDQLLAVVTVNILISEDVLRFLTEETSV